MARRPDAQPRRPMCPACHACGPPVTPLPGPRGAGRARARTGTGGLALMPGRRQRRT